MALVAGVGGHHRARHADRGAIRHEAEDVVGCRAPFVVCAVLRQVALGRDTDGVGNGGVESDWRLGLERVGIVADGIGGESSAGIVGGLSLRRVGVARNGRLVYGGGVRDVLRSEEHTSELQSPMYLV